jgi:hypothetical protein
VCGTILPRVVTVSSSACPHLLLLLWVARGAKVPWTVWRASSNASGGASVSMDMSSAVDVGGNVGRNYDRWGASVGIFVFS